MTKPKIAPKRAPSTKPKAAPKKRGPKPWEPTADQIAKVRAFAASGATLEMIADIFDVSKQTIRNHEPLIKAFHAGKAEALARVGGKLYQKAVGGDTASAIFYLKTQGGWREVNRTEHTGVDGGPVQMEVRDLSTFSDEQLDALERLALTFASGTGGAPEPA